MFTYEGSDLEKLVNAIHLAADHENIDPPETLIPALTKAVGEDVRIASLTGVGFACRKIRETLDSDDYAAALFGDIFSKIRAQAGFILMQDCGLEDYFSSPMRGSTASPREALMKFLESRPDKEEWSIADFKKWEGAGGMKGSVVVARIAAVTGEITKQVIHALLGPVKAEFKRTHPVKINRVHLRDEYDAARYLVEYLGTLKPGEKWRYFSLFNWTSKDGLSGENLTQYIAGMTGGSFQEASVRKLLRARANTLLQINPLVKRITTIHSIETAGNYLKEFLATLEAGVAWSQEDLTKWKGRDGTTGRAVKKWIWRKYEAVNETSLTAVIGKEALARNPFKKSPKINTNPGRAGKSLANFLSSLPPGTSWSLTTLTDYKPSETARASGVSIRAWIENNCPNGVAASTVRDLLGSKNVHLIDERPFIVENKITLRTIKDVRKALMAFLNSLPEGADWSPVDLQLAKGLGEKSTSGNAVYSWIDRNLSGGFIRGNIEKVIGKDSITTLERNPFKREKHHGRHKQ